MPIYEYRCESCGHEMEAIQKMSDAPLSDCPECGQPVRKLISMVGISVPKTNSELKDLGFTKLVKRDDGVYENVTARGKDSRYMERGKPETMPDLSKTIKD